MTNATQIRNEDKAILRCILLNVSHYGDDAKDVAEMCGCSVQRVVAVAKRYEGRNFRGGTISYIGSSAGGSWRKTAPGIKNPRTGICARIPASIAVRKR